MSKSLQGSAIYVRRWSRLAHGLTKQGARDGFSERRMSEQGLEGWVRLGQALWPVLGIQ